MPFGTLCGNTREVLHKFSVDLPKKHGRGGQSALRFARLRLEKRHNYVRKVAETAVQMFISGGTTCNVTGIILAGSAEFKQQLNTSDLFDQRLKKKVIKMVDVSYGGENGFNQAIELSAEALSEVKFVQEQKLITKYFNEISLDTGKYCFGIKDTFAALDLGAVEILMVWENLDMSRYELKNGQTGETSIIYLKPEDASNPKFFKDAETGVDLETVDKSPLTEWLAENYKNYGTQLEFVTDRSQEGSQFCKGFGGIGGILRWQVDFAAMEGPDDEYGSDGDEFDDDFF